MLNNNSFIRVKELRGMKNMTGINTYIRHHSRSRISLNV